MDILVTTLSKVWEIFEQVNVPILGISFARLYLSVFVINLSTVILRPILSIGFRSAKDDKLRSDKVKKRKES